MKVASLPVVTLSTGGITEAATTYNELNIVNGLLMPVCIYRHLLNMHHPPPPPPASQINGSNNLELNAACVCHMVSCMHIFSWTFN